MGKAGGGPWSITERLAKETVPLLSPALCTEPTLKGTQSHSDVAQHLPSYSHGYLVPLTCPSAFSSGPLQLLCKSHPGCQVAPSLPL